ncbi:hypothetical protein [Cellulosimicrobium protaetiae]
MTDTRIDLKATYGWRLCPHARSKAATRSVSAREVLEVVAAPDLTYTAFSDGPGRYVYQRGELGIVVVPAIKIIVTVLWRHEGQWTDDEFANRHAA